MLSDEQHGFAQTSDISQSPRAFLRSVAGCSRRRAGASGSWASDGWQMVAGANLQSPCRQHWLFNQMVSRPICAVVVPPNAGSIAAAANALHRPHPARHADPESVSTTRSDRFGRCSSEPVRLDRSFSQLDRPAKTTSAVWPASSRSVGSVSSHSLRTSSELCADRIIAELKDLVRTDHCDESTLPEIACSAISGPEYVIANFVGPLL